jgi:hypothetical protein
MVGNPDLAEHIPMEDDEASPEAPEEVQPEPEAPTAADAESEPTPQNLPNEPRIPPETPAKPLSSNDNIDPGFSPDALDRWHALVDLAERAGDHAEVDRLIYQLAGARRPQPQGVRRPPASGGPPGQRPRIVPAPATCLGEPVAGGSPDARGGGG